MLLLLPLAVVGLNNNIAAGAVVAVSLTMLLFLLDLSSELIFNISKIYGRTKKI